MASVKAPEVVRNADLRELSTFRLPARAARLAILESPDQLPHLGGDEASTLLLGGGSNAVFLGDWPGSILLNRIRGIEIRDLGDEALVTAGAGENWHRLVRQTMDAGWHGIENLIMIPGSVGAAPMQNIGAYGVELADVFEHLLAWDLGERRFVELDRRACRFGYRDSRFRSGDRGRFVIVSVTLRLSRRYSAQTGYSSLAGELERAGVENPSSRQLAAAVMRLRRHRLPDPGRLPNAGSFFKNPVISADSARKLLTAHPDVPQWPLPDGRVKLGAGRMIEVLGWKGKSIGEAGVYTNHALVLVNRGQATAADLRALIDAIVESVRLEFGIVLEPEPLLVDPDASLPAGQRRKKRK